MFLKLAQLIQISVKLRDDSSIAKGIGVIAGNDELSVLAWSDAGPAPKVHVYQYLLPSQIIDLRGTESYKLACAK